MSPFVSFVNNALTWLTVLGNLIIVLSLLSLFLPHPFSGYRAWVKKNALLFCFIVALLATSGSLFYSDVAGFEPCKLCWYQRILMYPQVILLAVAMKKKDRGMVDSILVLSILGAGIALYHYLLQLDLVPALPCSAVGYSASCSQRFFMNLGYITIPMMALTAFVMNIFFVLVEKSKKA